MTLSVGSGNDRIYGESGDEGDDTITRDAVHDLLRGGDGDDRFNGGNSNDRIYGTDGDAKIWGGTCADVISGGSDKDTIDSCEGNDTTNNDWPDDLMTGSDNNNVFGDDRTPTDTITDFTIGEDIIDIQTFGLLDIKDLNMVQDGDDVLSTFSDRDNLRLEGINLSNSDFNLCNVRVFGGS